MAAGGEHETAATSGHENGGGMLEMTGGSSLDFLPFGIGHPIAETLEVIAAFIDLIGVAIILFGFLVALWKLFSSLSHGIGFRRELMGLDIARNTLGLYILTGLEFMIASDIVHTVITREISDLIFVGLLVLIRTAISFFLGREIMELKAHTAPSQT
ncbi:MAG: DUF1622 domain-containing protein [Pseudomonadota bacterium]